MNEIEFHQFCLVKWRERERRFPPRVQRPVPDALDRASGAWAKFVAECRASLPPSPDKG